MVKNHSSLWSPNEAIKDKSQLKKFCEQLEKKHFLKHNVDFENLWKWSVKNPEIFWSEVWNFTKIKGTKGKMESKIPKSCFLVWRNNFLR